MNPQIFKVHPGPNWPAAPCQELFQVEQGETRLDGAFTLNPEKASAAFEGFFRLLMLNTQCGM